MRDPNPNIQEKLEALRKSDADSLPKQLQEVVEAWDNFRFNGFNEEKLTDLHRMVHSLAGSGKTFGFALVSERARNVERMLRKWSKELTHPDESERTSVTGLIGTLRECAQIEASPSSAELLNQAADKALYRAKKEGRNRVLV